MTQKFDFLNKFFIYEIRILDFCSLYTTSV